MEKNEPTQSKYDAALAKYNTQLDDAEIAAQAARIIAEKVPANNTPEVKKFLFNCIDLTTLNSTDSDESVMKFTQKVNKFDEEFPDLKNVAAICVYPNFAEEILIEKTINEVIMIVNLITQEDLKEFKIELLEDIKNLFNIKVSEQKLWLRSSEVKELLKISSGTLQNLRIKGTLSYTRVGGTLYYNYKDIEKMLKNK